APRVNQDFARTDRTDRTIPCHERVQLEFQAVRDMVSAPCRRAPFQRAKKRWVKVAMKVISMKRPITASSAASTATGSSSVSPPPGKKPRPWKEVTLKTNAASGEESASCAPEPSAKNAAAKPKSTSRYAKKARTGRSP